MFNLTFYFCEQCQESRVLIVEGLFFNVTNPLTENPVGTLLECVKPQIGLDLMQITRHACVTQNIS